MGPITMTIKSLNKSLAQLQQKLPPTVYVEVPTEKEDDMFSTVLKVLTVVTAGIAMYDQLKGRFK